MLKDKGYNPDVLTCIANLSSDEVFTPPNIADKMLGLLPESLWKDKNAKFLDPGCKSGVFLREIAKRLDKGLEQQIPDRQKRISHILTTQLYGLAITELTGLLARRSLYCSKTANGKYSVCSGFSETHGNIRFTRWEHNWKDGRCACCGAGFEGYNRPSGLENHAYQFIHLDCPEEIFNMKFDVIIGNPPYQIGSDGGTRDIPIYNLFVEQAKKLSPKYLSMVIPSRWMAGGLGLTEFRRSMLGDPRIRALVDFERMDAVFPGVDFEGGVCYFLWDRDNPGKCAVTTVSGDETYGPISRQLDEFDVFVRDARALEILHKVRSHQERSVVDILSVDKEFGWTSNFDGFHQNHQEGDVAIYFNRGGRRQKAWIARGEIRRSHQLVDKWKILVPKAYGERGARPSMVLGPAQIAEPPSACTQTYLFFYVESLEHAESVLSYMRTRFFRFLVSLRKISQDATRSTYSWVPQQEWNRVWTDEELYSKYDLSHEQIEFVESRIRQMGGLNG